MPANNLTAPGGGTQRGGGAGRTRPANDNIARRCSGGFPERLLTAAAGLRAGLTAMAEIMSITALLSVAITTIVISTVVLTGTAAVCTPDFRTRP